MVAVLSVAALWIVAGCTGPAGGQGVTTATPSRSRLDVGLVPGAGKDLYFATVAAGMQLATSELGGTLTQAPPPANAAGAQAESIRSLAQQGVSAIVVSPNREKATCEALAEARAEGVKVLTLDTDLPVECRDLFVNHATATGIANTLADMIASQIDYGEVGVIASSRSAAEEAEWIRLTKRRLASTYPNVSITTVVYDGGKADASAKAAAGLIDSNTRLRGIIATTPTGLLGAAKHLDASSSRTKPGLTGLGNPNSMRSHVQSGIVAEFALWDPEDLGYLATYSANALVRGDITGEKGQKFTAGKLMRMELQANSTVVLGEPFRFDQHNIDRFNF